MLRAVKLSPGKLTTESVSQLSPKATVTKLKPSEVHGVLKFVRYLRNPQNATILGALTGDSVIELAEKKT
jgi:hypothetical protein